MASTSFYIARRYLLAKKGSQAVSFITGLAALAMMVAVASMFIIVSVFSGLIDLNKEMIADFHADMTIAPAEGKLLPDLDNVTGILKKNEDITHFSKVIEEKAYVTYEGNGEIVYLRGVDSAYTQVNPIDKDIFFGQYPTFTYSNEAAMEVDVDSRLGIPVNTDDFAQILMPKPGTGLINKEEDIFNKKDFYTVGIFRGNGQLNNYVIAPLELSAELLEIPKNSAYSIVMKLKPEANPDKLKSTLQKELGSKYVVKTKAEENAAFWKMINTEKLMIYLIFGLVIFITTFNLAGAVIIIQLDKKEQAATLLSLGVTKKGLRKIYFYTGLLIVLFGIVMGLLLGTLISGLQLYFGWFKATEFLPFPIKIELKNYFIVAGTALGFGSLISWLFSRGKRSKNTSWSPLN